MYLFDLENQNNISIPPYKLLASKARLNIHRKNWCSNRFLVPLENTFHLSRDKVLEKFIEFHTAGDRRVYLAQEFIPGITNGEISIIKLPIFFSLCPKVPAANEFKVQTKYGGTVSLLMFQRIASRSGKVK